MLQNMIVIVECLIECGISAAYAIKDSVVSVPSDEKGQKQKAKFHNFKESYSEQRVNKC